MDRRMQVPTRVSITLGLSEEHDGRLCLPIRRLVGYQADKAALQDNARRDDHSVGVDLLPHCSLESGVCGARRVSEEMIPDEGKGKDQMIEVRCRCEPPLGGDGACPTSMLPVTTDVESL